jgi:hypothetical protein
MANYKGIEKVDPQTLSAQRLLTEALWQTLQEQGVKDGTARRIECLFVARGDSVASLLNAVPEKSEWDHQVSAMDDPPGAVSVKVISPLVHLTKEALMDLVDVMMIAADESGCVFDGFQVDVTNLQQRPWWKFWRH